MAESGSITPIQPSIRIYAIISGVLGILFVIVLVLYIGLLQQNRRTPTDAHSIVAANNNDQNTQKTPSAAGIPAEPSSVFTRTGTIVRVTKEEIAFTTTMFDNGKGAYVETEMTALTKDAQYIELDKTKNAPPIPGQQSQTSKGIGIRRDSLKPGEKIQVFAASNIQGKRRFPVNEVRRLLLR